MNNINKKILGIWLYFITDCITFLCLFISFYISKKNFYLLNNFYNYRVINLETIILLICSFLTIKYIKKNKKKYLILNILNSILFLILEYKDLYHLFKINLNIKYNNFFSNYYIIIFFHGIHVLISIFFCLNLIFLNFINLNFKILNIMFSYFWHFIHLIWLCLILVIYLKKY